MLFTTLNSLPTTALKPRSNATVLRRKRARASCSYLFDISLPHLPKRTSLQAAGLLAGARRSALEDELDELEAEIAAGETTAITAGGHNQSATEQLAASSPAAEAASTSEHGRSRGGDGKRVVGDEGAIKEPIRVYEAAASRGGGEGREAHGRTRERDDRDRQRYARREGEEESVRRRRDRSRSRSSDSVSSSCPHF